MEFLIILAVMTVVAVFVTRPVWQPPAAASSGGLEPGDPTVGGGLAELRAPSDSVAELEAAREAKYREIRDAELDRRTGKLSDEDYEAIDRSLRAEAVVILNALDEAREQLPSPD
jgi:hypothetical protein